MPELIGHTIALGISIAVVISMAAVLNVVRQESQYGVSQLMAENICAQIKLAAESMGHSSQSSGILMQFPDKIGGEMYSVNANGKTISVASASSEERCFAGTAASLSGSSVGGDIRLTFYGSNMILSKA